MLPYVQPYIDNPQIAMAASAGAVFIVALIIVTLITMKIADCHHRFSRIGALDRTLGFLYGAARGILVVAVALLFFDWLVGAKPPAWIAEAKSRPLLESIGKKIEDMLPDDPENSILKRLSPSGDAAPEGGAEAPQTDTPPAEGRRRAGDEQLTVRAGNRRWRSTPPSTYIAFLDTGPPHAARARHLARPRPTIISTTNAACSAFSAARTPPRSSRSGCTRCSIAARKRRASSPMTARSSTSSAMSA